MPWFAERSQRFEVMKPHVGYERRATGEGINRILKIDFKGYQEFVCTDTIFSCVIVAASDLKMGSFSHLTPRCNPADYARALAQYWGKYRPGLILVGGDESAGIRDIGLNVSKALEKEGFRISGSQLGGSWVERHVVMHQNDVVVEEGKSRVSRVIKFKKIYG